MLQLYSSFMTPTNAPFIYTDTVLHCSYMFRHYLRYPKGTLHKDLKLIKI
jgi:hypothetical protein